MPQLRAIECPSCGGAVELRGFAHTMAAVCPNCLSVIDPSTPVLKILHDGHWNYLRPVRGLPVQSGYRHFQTAKSKTTFAMSEFPGRVKVGDRVEVTDFVKPPYLLSQESTGNEMTWSRGEYRTGAQITAAFGLKEPLPAAEGVSANQPNPSGTESWIYWNIALVNANTGQGWEFGREIDWDGGGGRRNVPHYWIFWLAAPLLGIPAILQSTRRSAFETRRWQASDYAR